MTVVKVAKPDTALTDEEFEAELSRVLDGYATVEPVEEDRALVDGDWAEIEFAARSRTLAQTVTEDGVTSTRQPEPITGEDVLIEIGGKNTLPAFNEALRGAKVGQELTFEVDVSGGLRRAQAGGPDGELRRDGEGDQEEDLPERDAEFAKQLGNYESWEEFESQLREHAPRPQEARRWRARRKDKMLDEMIGRYQFPVPESFVQQQVDARLDRGLRALAQQGMKSEDMRKLDFGRLRAAQRDQAVNEVKASMILDRMAEAEGVAVAMRAGPRAADAFDPVARAAGDAARAVGEGWWVGPDSRADAAREDGQRAV